MTYTEALKIVQQYGHDHNHPRYREAWALLRALAKDADAQGTSASPHNCRATTQHRDQ